MLRELNKHRPFMMLQKKGKTRLERYARNLSLSLSLSRLSRLRRSSRIRGRRAKRRPRKSTPYISRAEYIYKYIA